MKTALKLASQLFIPSSTGNCVNTSCMWGSPASPSIFHGRGTEPVSGLAALFFFFSFFLSRRFRGHASRSGKRHSDEHIIQRTSLLTMPIYFDNQFTIVPVQLLKGQSFIRIDQFWVTSCAALWGQTEAWLAVQSGMLSNARAWLTAHQHAELNSRTKEKNKTKQTLPPFRPDIEHSYKTMNASLR